MSDILLKQNNMKTYIGPKGYTILKSDISTKQQDKIYNDLMMKPFVPPNSIQQPVEFPIYRESCKKLYVPRFYGIQQFGQPKEIKIGNGRDINIEFKASLRDYQVNIINAFLEESKKSGCGLLDIHCGAGKTVMGLNIISRLKKKTLIIVHKEFLLNQWIERIEQFLPDAKIGKIQGKIIDIEGKDIVIGMLQSLSMKEYSDISFDKEFGLTIIDECHHISAEVFCRSLFKIVTKYMLGLSATMNRKDGLTKVFKMFIGDVVYQLKNTTKHDVLVKTIQYKNSDPDFSETVYNFKGQTHYSIMIRKLCEFNHRTEFILNVLQDIIKEGNQNQIMILAHNRSLLTYFHDAIQSRNIASVGYYVGGMKEKALKETENKKIVIATYAMAEEGLDIKGLSCLIMATPKTDITQAVGRILRIKHDEPLVVDIVDQHDIFQKQYMKRRRFYTKSKYKIIQTTNLKYSKNEWETIFEPGEKENNYRKKIKKSETSKFLQGKCML